MSTAKPLRFLRRYLFAVIILQFSAVFAQKDFKPGKIITSDGSVVPGMVSKKSGDTQCIFRSDTSSEKIYTPSEIMGYSFDGGKSYQVKIIKGLNAQFVEVLVLGKVRLYRFGSRYFIEREGKELTELRITSKTVTMREGGREIEVGFKEYLGMLETFLSDCPNIYPRIRTTQLAENDLVKLMKEYYKCVGETATISKANIARRQTSFGLAAGYVSQNWGSNISAEKIPIADVGSLTKGSSYFVGVSVETSSPRINRRLYFKGEILFIAPTQFASLKTVQTSPFTTALEYLDISHSSVRVPLLAKYAFTENKFFSPYANIGLSAIIFNTRKNVRSTESRSGSSIYIERTTAFETRGVSYSGVFGVGSKFNLTDKFYIDIEVRGEAGHGIAKSMNQYADLFPLENNLYLTVRFGITKLQNQ